MGKKNLKASGKREFIYYLGAFYYHFSFFLSSLVLLSIKKRRFEREAVQQVLEWFFFLPFFLISVQFCFLTFGLFPFIISFVNYFVLHPPHFTLPACDLRMRIDFALDSDFRGSKSITNFLGYFTVQGERAQKVSVCRWGLKYPLARVHAFLYTSALKNVKKCVRFGYDIRL